MGYWLLYLSLEPSKIDGKFPCKHFNETQLIQEQSNGTVRPPFPSLLTYIEYNEIEVPAAVDLIVALKRGPQQSAPFPAYPTPYAAQPSPLPAGVNPNLANIIGSMNPAALQKVLGAIAQQQPIVAPPAAVAYGGYTQAGALQGVLGQGNVHQGYSGQPAAQPTQQVQDIMAQLAALSRKT